MPPRSTNSGDLLSMAEKQGEMFEAVRATKHAVANLSQKMDAIGAVVTTVEQLARDRDDHERRLAVLEADKHRREGAVGLVEWISKHWPFTIIIAVVMAAWAFLSGKVSS